MGNFAILLTFSVHPALPLPDTHTEETFQQVCEGTYEDVLWDFMCKGKDEIGTQPKCRSKREMVN